VNGRDLPGFSLPKGFLLKESFGPPGEGMPVAAAVAETSRQ